MTDKDHDVDGSDDEPGYANERFLINEGLDLLSSFRSIEDENIRKALLTLVAALANANALR